MRIEHKTIKASSKLNDYRSNSVNGRLSYATKQMRTTIIVSPSKEMHILNQRRVQKWLGCTINHNKVGKIG
ncbi:MAG: hypothetical protein WBE61_10850 [Nitrososphaeraceae archaeon]